MSFVIKKKETFVWPVTLKTPSDDGKFEDQKIDLEFRILKSSEIKEILSSKKITDVIFCQKIVKNWKDVKDEKGEPVVFSKPVFEDFLENFGYAKEIVTQYLAAISGEAFEKN